MLTPEQIARQQIDKLLQAAAWAIQIKTSRFSSGFAADILMREPGAGDVWQR